MSDLMAKSIKDAMEGNALLMALMNILLGIIMLALGNGSIDFIFWLSGVVMIIIGILEILLKSTDIKGGLIMIIVGIILIVIAWFPAVAEVLVGIILIFSALPALTGASNGIAEKFGMKVDAGSATINKILAIVLLVVGVCLIVGLFLLEAGSTADILIRVGGVVLLVMGLIGLLKALK